MKKDFTYEQFTNEQKDYHVFNQEKYTKEEALEITKKEYEDVWEYEEFEIVSDWICMAVDEDCFLPVDILMHDCSDKNENYIHCWIVTPVED